MSVETTGLWAGHRMMIAKTDSMHGLTVGGTPSAEESKGCVAVVVEHGITGRDGGTARGGPIDVVRVECVHRIWPKESK